MRLTRPFLIIGNDLFPSARSSPKDRYTRHASLKTGSGFPRPCSKIPARFRAAPNPVAHLWPHVFRVPRHCGYNTLHFALQSRVPKGIPLWKPRTLLRVNLTRSSVYTQGQNYCVLFRLVCCKSCGYRLFDLQRSHSQ